MLLLYRWIGAPGFENPGKTASNGDKIELASIGLAVNLIARPPPTALKV
jgi:hypothetical protein